LAKECSSAAAAAADGMVERARLPSIASISMSTHFANASISARPAAECVRASSAAAAPPDSLAAAFAFAAVDGRGCAARMIEHRQNRRCELLSSFVTCEQIAH
jgi:hypothetical protein